MWRREALLIALFVGAGCFDRAPYDRAYVKQYADINAKYDEQRTEAVERWDKIAAGFDDLAKFTIEVKPGSQYSPAERVDGQPTVVEFNRTCAKFETDAAAATDSTTSAELRELAAKCRNEAVQQVYGPLIVQKYFKADWAWVSETFRASKGTADLEALLAYSHNVTIRAEINARKPEIRTSRDRAIADIEQLRQMELAGAANIRDSAVAAAQERNRRTWAAVAAGLQAAGDSLSQQSATRATSQAWNGSAPSSSGCSSDFDCGVGNQCVKQNYSSRGVCMRSVNEYGNQTFGLPRLNSVMPKMPVSTDCKGFTDCPIGFRCDTGSGTCLR